MTLPNRRFLIDTDIISLGIRGNTRVQAQMASHRYDLAVSSITAAELGVYKLRTRSDEVGKLIELFLAEVPIIAFDARIAKIAGGITTSLMAEGNPIGFADIAIAATALNIDAVLVSNNLRHFDRIQELEALNWDS